MDRNLDHGQDYIKVGVVEVMIASLIALSVIALFYYGNILPSQIQKSEKFFIPHGREFEVQKATINAMAEKAIAAEIQPAQNQAHQAALALQNRGFRILHIGSTISVQGAPSLWESTFDVAFTLREKTVMPEIGHETSYLSPIPGIIPIPAEFQNLILDVMFVEPSQLY